MKEYFVDWLRYTVLSILWLILLPISLLFGFVLGIDWLINGHKETMEESKK